MYIRTAILVLFSALSAHAEVSLKNGNFYVSFTDIKLEGGLEPQVKRVYNSAVDFKGMFGYGWGTEYEVTLRPDPDGSILITEYGGGLENRFLPKNYSGEKAKEIAEQLVKATKKAGGISNANGEAVYRDRVMKDPIFRGNEWKKFSERGLLNKIALKEGEQLVSALSQYQYITKVKGGYVLVSESGIVRKFDERGRLVQISDKSGAYLNIFYDNAGHLGTIVDNMKRKLTFSYSNRDRVVKIVGESNKSCEYNYDKNGMLSYSKASDGSINTYKYTDDRFSLLLEVGYPKEKKAQKITYHGVDKNLHVKSVENVDGYKYEYDYVMDRKKPDYYAASVTAKDSRGNLVTKSKYEYFSKRRKDGETISIKMIEDVDGRKTETQYDENLGYPIKINENGRITKMEYDQKGRMTKKVTPFETSVMSYDPKVGKLKRIQRSPVSGKVTWSEFDYDPKSSQLVGARNSDKQAVKVVYDNKSRPKIIVDHKKHSLTFVYNELGKPIEISDAHLGKLKFTYKNSGEVDKVDSVGGAKVSQEISEVIQTFYDLVKPAGVTISF